VPIRQIVSLLESLLQRTARIELLPEKPGEMRITCADLDKAHRLFGYSPRIPLEQGLAEFVSWYRQNT
jgi:UDP-glucuronate 4-epimerase